MGSVFIKEFKSLLRNIRVIICITALMIATGIVFVLRTVRIAYPVIDATVSIVSIISAIVIPAVVCFCVTADVKKGRGDLFSTLPVTKKQIFFGKLLANVVLFMIPTAVICLYPVLLGSYGTISYSYSYVAILVLAVFEIFVITLCAMTSCLFKKSWQALVCAYSVLVVLFLIGSLSVLLPTPVAQICRFLSPFRQFDPIVYGRLDLSSMLYYLLLSVLFVVICLRYYSVKRFEKNKDFKICASCAVLAAIVICISAASAFLPASLRFADVSGKGTYKIDPKTKQFLSSLDEDVTVYLIDEDTTEQKLISFIERYCSRSSHIKLQRVDTSKDTEFRARYGFNEEANLSFCMVVESESRTRIISADELFVWYNASYPDFGYMSSSDLSTNISYLATMLEQYSAYYSQMSSTEQTQLQEYATMYESLYYMSARYLDAQNVMNAAIDYVTADVIPTFYFATGHGEKNTSAGPLDITGIDKIPTEAAMIFINAPDTDYTDAQVDMLIEYMRSGGRLVVLTNEANNSMPNLMRLLGSVGLSVDEDDIVNKDESPITATVNTKSKVFSALASTASTEKLTLDMIGGSAILTDESNGTYKYDTLFSFDVVEKLEGEDGNDEANTQPKVVTRKLGVCVSENSEPVLVWVSAADTFNRDSASISDEDIEQYTVAMECLQYIVLANKKTYQTTVDSVNANEYDVSTPLELEDGDTGFVGVVVIGIIPLFFLGACLICVYVRKKRTAKVTS